MEPVNGGELASDPTRQGTAPPLTGFTGEQAPMQVNDALTLEYQGQFRDCRERFRHRRSRERSQRQRRIVLDLRFSEQGKDRLLGKRATFSDDSDEALLVCLNTLAVAAFSP